MNKVARKPSSDPLQEKLRQNKAQWNKEVSSFIGDLINLKKTMNGWPSKFHMERSSIKEPIPADPPTILGVLAGDFQDIAQKGNDLVKQQLDYSKNRKKKQPKAPLPIGTPISTPQAPDLSQQLAAASIEFDLIAEASNPFSRFISTFKSPWFGGKEDARAKKYRISMLRAAADLNKELKKFENQIMGSSPESIFAAGKMLIKIENQLYYLQDSLNVQNQLNPNISEKKPAPVEQQSSNVISVKNPLIEEAKLLIDDFRKSQPNFSNLTPALEKDLNDWILKFYNTVSDEDKLKVAPHLVESYNNLLVDTNMKNGTNEKSLSDILMSKTANAHLQVVAQNILTKWLGQLKHKLTPFDKTSALRLDLLRLSQESRKIINSIMNLLEKEIDVKTISEYLSLIDKNLLFMRQIMKPLENTIRGNMFDKTFLNMLKNKKITEHSFGLEPKQQQNLERMLQNKQYRELVNMYARK